MNKEYTYIDGKVIVRDEKGRQKVVEYYDNIAEVLKQENLFEEIEKKIVQLENEKEQFGKNKKYIPFLFPIVLLITPIIVPIIFKMLGISRELKMTVDTIFGTMNNYIFFTGIISLVSLPLGVFGELSIYNCYKDSKKHERAINAELEFLKNARIAQKELLEQLKNKKTKEKECENFTTVKVENMRLLNNLKGHMKLYYEINYDINKYYKYYQKGKLSGKLSNSYNEKGIEIAEQILEEKGPTLVKKRLY